MSWKKVFWFFLKFQQASLHRVIMAGRAMEMSAWSMVFTTGTYCCPNPHVRCMFLACPVGNTFLWVRCLSCVGFFCSLHYSAISVSTPNSCCLRVSEQCVHRAVLQPMSIILHFQIFTFTMWHTVTALSPWDDIQLIQIRGNILIHVPVYPQTQPCMKSSNVFPHVALSV